MKPIQNPITALILISVVAALGGCATTSETKTLEAGPTMAQAYQAAMQESDGNSLQAVRASTRIANEFGAVAHRYPTTGVKLTQASVQKQEIQNEFQQLPNPAIAIYVCPHLATQDELPIQGYYTEISFYEHVHYAIPGEMHAIPIHCSNEYVVALHHSASSLTQCQLRRRRDRAPSLI